MHGPQVQRDTDELEINLNRWLLRKLTRRYRSQRTDPHNPNIAQLNGRRKLIICSRHQDHSVHNSGDTGSADGVFHRFLSDGLVNMMTSFRPALAIEISRTRRKDPLPQPRSIRVGILHQKRIRQSYASETFRKIASVEFANRLKMIFQVLLQALRKNGMPVLLPLGVPDENVITGKIDVFHP